MKLRDIPLHFPEVWDDTMRRNFATCPTKWAYSDIFHAALPGKNIHLESGGVFASAIETARRSYYEELKDPWHSVNDGFVTLLREWDSGELPINDENGDKKNLISVGGAYASYFERYPLDTDPIRAYITPEGKAGVEFNFALPIDVNHPVTGQPIIYAGRFDMLGLFQDGLWVVDEKTTSRLGQSWGKQWRLRSQFTGYCWGAREHNLSVVGAIIRGVSILSGGFGHEEVMVYRPQWMLDQWYMQLIREIEQAKRIYNDMCDMQAHSKYSPLINVNRSNGEACSAYSGCPYMLLCEARDPLDWMETNYEYHHWDPVTRISVDKPFGQYLLELKDE